MAKKSHHKKHTSKKKNGVLQVRNTYDMGLFTGSVKRSLPLGKTMKVKLKYAAVDTTLTTTAGGQPGQYAFRLNSIFDPNQTGIGRKARGFDELMTFYNSYVVIGCRMTAIRRASPVDGSFNGNSGIFGVLIKSSQDQSSIVGLEGLLEQGYCRYQDISPFESTHIRIDINPNQYLGIKNPLDDDGVHGDTITQSSENPSEQVLGIVFADLGLDNPNTDVRFDVILEYTAILFDPASDIPPSP